MAIPVRSGKIGSLIGLIEKRAFSVSLQKYPNRKGTWMLEGVAKSSAAAKANFRIAVSENSLTLKHLTSIRVGGSRVLMNISRAVGNIGEAKLIAQLRSGVKNFPNPSPPPPLLDVNYTNIIQVQNKSGQGLDVVAKIAPPSSMAGKWVAFEAKSKMETPNFPAMSAAQKNDPQDYVRSRAQRAMDGAAASMDPGAKTTTWAGMVRHMDELEDLKNAAQNQQVITVHAKIDLNRFGNQVGDTIMGAW